MRRPLVAFFAVATALGAADLGDEPAADPALRSVIAFEEHTDNHTALNELLRRMHVEI